MQTIDDTSTSLHDIRGCLEGNPSLSQHLSNHGLHDGISVRRSNHATSRAMPKQHDDQIEEQQQQQQQQEEDEELPMDRKVACQIANEIYKEKFETSCLRDRSILFPKFQLDELNNGKILGSGGFGTVYEIRGFDLKGPSTRQKSSRTLRTSLLKKQLSAPLPTTSLTSTALDMSSVASDANNNNNNITNINRSNSFHNRNPAATDEGEKSLHLEDIHAVNDNDNTNKNNSPSEYNNDDATDEDDTLEMQSRKFIAEHCLRKGKEARYAIKRLSQTTIDDPDRLIRGIVDMGTETRLLSSLKAHPNIIKLRAICRTYSDSGEKDNAGEGMLSSRSQHDHRELGFMNEHYFIVLDRLYDTLETRLQQWSKKQKRLDLRFRARKVRDAMMLKNVLFKGSSGSGERGGGSIGSSRRGMKKKKMSRIYCAMKEFYGDRLVHALDLASAITHIHSHHLMHRDLKPENIGFDVRGDIKVFDFGLAKEIPKEHTDDSNGLYYMTAMCGTPRYMAPEVAIGKPYNESCDVYSFSMLLWQIMQLEVPFGATLSFDELHNEIWSDKEKRPPLPMDESINRNAGDFISEAFTLGRSRSNYNKGTKKRKKFTWSESLQNVVRRSWSADIFRRPTMSEVEYVLGVENMKQEDDEMDGFNGEFDASERDDLRSMPLTTFDMDVSSRSNGTGRMPRRRSTFIFQPKDPSSSYKELFFNASWRNDDNQSAAPSSPGRQRQQISEGAVDHSGRSTDSGPIEF